MHSLHKSDYKNDNDRGDDDAKQNATVVSFPFLWATAGIKSLSHLFSHYYFAACLWLAL